MCNGYGLTGLSLNEGSTSSTNSKDDEQKSEEDKLDYNLYSSITDARPKFSNLKPLPPPVASHHNRQNRGCNTPSSVRYVL
jgi:hypothetical protein